MNLPNKHSKFKAWFKEWTPTFAIILTVLFFKLFIITNFNVDGLSMYPTLHNGDTVIVNQINSYTKNFKRGDMIVLHSPEKNEYWVKRIIALPFETIESIEGKIYVNENVLKESYLPSNIETLNMEKTTVPEGYVYVMGDNRPFSKDSRKIGPIKISSIKGNVIYKFNLFK